MNSVKFKKLQLFEALEENCAQSQRELSKNLNISLGSVNQLLNDLISKGYLTVSPKRRKKAGYSITLEGTNEKSKLLFEFIRDSIKHYEYLKSKISRLVEGVLENDKEKVMLYGANEFTEIVIMILNELNVNFVGIVDDQQAGKKVLGEPVNEISFLREKSFDILIISLIEIPETLIEYLNENGVPFQKIQGIREAFDSSACFI